MKNKTEFFVSSAVSFVLVLSLIWCFSSSFYISLSPFVSVSASLIFTAYFAIIASLVKKKSLFWMCHLVTAAVFVLTILFSFDILLSQINYAVNCVLGLYSRYLPCPVSVTFSSAIPYNADYLFVVISLLLCSAVVNSLVRVRRYFPVVLLSVLFLIPCFIIVNSTPTVAPLVLTVSLLFALFLTSFIRRKNPAQSGTVMLGATAVTLVISIIICIIFPAENYKRYEWQDNLLDYAESVTGIKGERSEISSVGNFITDTEDLTKLGKLKQRGKRVMEIQTESDGYVYLKGVAYSVYEDNKWSIMNEEQEARYYDKYKPFTSTRNAERTIEKIKIITENREQVAYLPYFTQALPDKLVPVKDVLVKNTEKSKLYELEYAPYRKNGEYTTEKREYFNEYANYVAENYVDISEDTRKNLIEIGEQNGIRSPSYSVWVSNAEYAQMIKELVSKVGYYSLDAEPMPDGEDFPVWFLTEAKSGYCVHYAATAAVMLRAYGVPARYVTGYLVDARAGERTVVTSDNAHAWVEYFDEASGWMPLEVTPSSFEPARYEPDKDETKATQSNTKPSATQPTTAVQSNTNTKSKSNISINPIVLLVSILLLLVTALYIRRRVILALRKNRISKGRNNSKAINIYRRIEAVGRFSNNIIPDEIRELAQKARFSNHTLSDDEVERLNLYYKDTEQEFMKNCSRLRLMYFKYILVLI